MIIETSLELLRLHSVEGFTLARVADRLDTVSMALYNYFPSREALLAECANHIGKQFVMPQPRKGQDWKKTLRDWLWTLRDLGERYPVIFKIAGVEGKTSAGWLRITRVVGTILYHLGFRDKELALNSWLVCLQAHALVQAEVTDGGFHTALSLSRRLGPALATAAIIGALSGALGYVYSFFLRFPVGASQASVAGVCCLLAMGGRLGLSRLRLLRDGHRWR